MVLILLLSSVSSVLCHGGMVWPPIWQVGEGLGIDEVYMSWIGTDPPQVDPKTGRKIDNTKSWSTDQAYTYGHGFNETLAKTGPTPTTIDALRKSVATPGNVRSGSTLGQHLAGHLTSVRHPWQKPLRLSCRARRPGPGLCLPTGTNGRRQGHMDLWQQCPGDRVPRGEDDQVVPRQHGARCLFSNLVRWWIYLQAVQNARRGKERPH